MAVGAGSGVVIGQHDSEKGVNPASWGGVTIEWTANNGDGVRWINRYWSRSNI